MGMNLATAEAVSTWANWILLASLLVGVAATYAIVVTADIKEKALKLDISANERATAEAKLELAKFRAPRILTPEQQARISASLKPFAGTAFDVAIGPMGDPEPEVFATALSSALTNADWRRIEWKTRDAQLTLSKPGVPTLGFAAVTNVFVDIHPSQAARLWPVAQAVAKALASEGIAAIAQQGSGGRNTNENAIHIMVGRKM